jgi:hypothetical protein
MCGNVSPKMTWEEAEAYLRKWLGSRVVDLRVRHHDSGLALQGIAYSYHAKQLAQHGAMRVFDLPILVNEIEVRLNVIQPTSNEPDPP